VSDTVERIEALLREAFAPASLHVDDESALHAGHAGARSGGGHYRVDIVSEAFAGKNTVARHRLIYSALGELIPGAIHALAIRASAPDEL
jgi:BolA protein